MIKFGYEKNWIRTIDELKVSVADLRDLVQAQNIENDEQKLAEIKLVLDSILRKNGLPKDSMSVE